MYQKYSKWAFNLSPCRAFRTRRLNHFSVCITLTRQASLPSWCTICIYNCHEHWRMLICHQQPAWVIIPLKIPIRCWDVELSCSCIWPLVFRSGCIILCNPISSQTNNTEKGEYYRIIELVLLLDITTQIHIWQR